jgi:hypothetical protein
MPDRKIDNTQYSIIKEIYGGTYLPSRITRFGIGASVIVVVLLFFTTLALQLPEEDVLQRLLIGGQLVFSGVAGWLYFVLDVWQTRRFIRFKAGPTIKYDESPKLYKFLLVLFTLICISIVAGGLAEGIGLVHLRPRTEHCCRR